MKKTNLEQTERWLSEEFGKTERHIKYNGNALSRIKEDAKDSGSYGFFQYPAVRILGAFLVLVLIGGSLFGALKFLEYKGTKINTSYSAKTGDDDEVITYVKGNTNKENRYLTVISDKKVYYPNVYLISSVKQLPSGKTDYTDYSIAKLDTIDIPYGDGFSIVNNVSDREMTIRSVAINDPADERAVCIPLYTDLDGLYDHLSKSSADKIMVEIDVTWDTGDEIYVYNVIFNVIKEKSAPGEAVLISDINGIKTYDYEKKLEKLQKAPYDGDPGDFVRVLTGGELYTAPVGRAYDAERQTAVKHYDFDADPPIVEFGGDLQLYNNVTDKQMDIISVSVILPDGKKSGGSLTNVFREIYAGKAGSYIVKAYVSWDKTYEETVSEKYTVYCVYFVLHKSESYDGIDKVWYSEGKQKYNCRYYTVFSAGDYCYPYMPCKKYVKMKSDNVTGQKGFDDEHLLPGEIHIPYSGSFEILNNVYDREMTVISLTVKDGAGTETETTIDELKEYLKSADAGTYCVSLLLTWDTYPVLTKGDEAYIYTSSFYVEKSDNVTDTTPGETAAEETTGPEEQSIEFSPLGMISIIWKVRNTVCKVYNPPVMQKRVYKDGAIAEELSYDSDPCDVEYRYTDSLAAENESYSNVWRVISVTVNKEKEFGSFETAFEYIHDLAENSSGSAYVEAAVTWDAGALLNKDADRTEYTFAFNVLYTCPDDIDPKDDPYVTKGMKGWVAVNIGTEKKTYFPGVTKMLNYTGDQVTEFEYNHDDLLIEWHPGQQISVSNQIYTLWHFYGISVNGVKYDTVNEAVAALPKDRVSHVEIEASWGISAWQGDPYAADRTTYVYGFDIKPVPAE